MRAVVTLGTVSMAVPREGYIVVAVAARRASMPGMMRRAHVPHVVSQPSKGHHHEASRPECQAEHVWIHGVLPTNYSVTRCVQTPGKGSMSQALCKRIALLTTRSAISGVSCYASASPERSMCIAPIDANGMDDGHRHPA